VIDTYGLRKSWHATATMYQLVSELRALGTMFLSLAVIWVLGSVATAAAQYVSFPESHDSPGDFLSYFWIVILELVSSELVGDIQLGLPGQIVSVIMILTGVAVIGIFTAKIITILVRVGQSANLVSQYPGRFRFRNPILICGVNAKLPQIIREIRGNQASREREIIVIDPSADALTLGDRDCRRDVWGLAGDPGDRSILTRCLGSRSSAVIILASESAGRAEADAAAIRTAVAVNGLDGIDHTIIEMRSPQTRKHIQPLGIREWISIYEIGSSLLAQNILQKDSYAVIRSTLSLQEYDPGDERHRIAYRQQTGRHDCAGMSFRDARRRFIHGNDREILIGLITLRPGTLPGPDPRPDWVLLNPRDVDRIIEPWEELIIIGTEQGA
jgi:hypothetical protein